MSQPPLRGALLLISAIFFVFAWAILILPVWTLSAEFRFQDKVCLEKMHGSGLTLQRLSGKSAGMAELLWCVAHTKPRCEKKLADWCSRQGFKVSLPCYEAPHKYRGKTVVFRKPLFPGYVFLRLDDQQKQKVRYNDHTANLLEVVDQETFERQFNDILRALEANVGVRLAPSIGEGMRVRIKVGPLQGIEGWVERRYGMSTVLLRLDFINQAAAVKVEADTLELL